MLNRLIIPISDKPVDFRAPLVCIKCGAPTAKLFKLLIERRFTFKLFGDETSYELPLPFCKSCNKRRKVTSFATWVVFYCFFGGVPYLIFFVLRLDLNSPLSGPLIFIFFAIGLFVRIGFFNDLIIWFTVDVHGVLMRGAPPRIRLAVRDLALFRTLRNSR